MSKWLHCLQARPRPAARLVCFPYAGGGLPVFRDWPAALPAGVEVWVVHLPGRGSRFSEPPLRRLEPLVAELGQALRPLAGPPLAFFGHSLGGLVAFELARWLRKRAWRQPAHLFVSACPAPQLSGGRRAIHTLPDADFVAELRRRNGTPAAVLDNAELLELLLPMVRADYEMYETYAYRPAAPLPIPLTALWGTTDAIVSRPEVEAWQVQTSATFRLEEMAGDHFFLHETTAAIGRLVGRALLSS